MKNLLKILAFSVLTLALTSCVHRMVDFTIISTKSHSLQIDRAQGIRTQGESIGFLGFGANIKTATDRALMVVGPEYDLLLDGVIYSVSYPFASGFRVRGLAFSSRRLISLLGKDGFQEWLTENNVFDPETATVDR